MSLQLQVKHDRDVLIIRLAGELDHHTAEQVRRAIESEFSKGIYEHLVFNMADLDFMDSSGLGVILGRYKMVSERGGKMTLCNMRPSIHRLMEMSGMFRILSIYDDERSAISACGVAS